MGCTTIFLIIFGIIAIALALGVSIYLLMGTASVMVYSWSFVKWAIPKLKKGNPSLFILIILLGCIPLAMGYYSYYSSKNFILNNDYGYFSEQQMKRKEAIFKDTFDDCWKDNLPFIIPGYILVGIGVAGTASTVIIYQVKKRKSEEDTEA